MTDYGTLHGAKFAANRFTSSNRRLSSATTTASTLHQFSRHLFALVVLFIYSSTAAYAQDSYIEYPENGDVLTSDSQIFRILASKDRIEAWRMLVGSSKRARDYADTKVQRPGTPGDRYYQNYKVSGLPIDGSRVYVRYWYKPKGQNWTFEDTSYVAQTGITPRIITPAQLKGQAHRFRFSDRGYGATKYLLVTYDSPGKFIPFYDERMSRHVTSYQSVFVEDLPTSDESSDQTIYATLFAMRPGVTGWVRVDEAIVNGLNRTKVPSFVSPKHNTTLTSTAQTFSWIDNGTNASRYRLLIGARHGGRDYYDSGILRNIESEIVTALPNDGSKIYVRFWYYANRKWTYIDEQYEASGVGPQITDPVPGSALDDWPVQFNWTDNGTGVTQWRMYFGSETGAKNLFDSGNLGNQTSITLPLSARAFPDGRTYPVRLWFRYSAVDFWKHIDVPYTTTD